MASKKKFYVVWRGVEPGIYDSWKECERQIRGIQDAQYKSFPTREMAEEALRGSPFDYYGTDFNKKQATAEEIKKAGHPNPNTICVDAACSGNPGDMEYRGVETRTRKELFRVGPYFDGTVNIGEFLAIVHALAYLKNKKSTIPIYTDSRNAMKWVKQKKTNTKLVKTPLNAEIFNLIVRAEKWLRENEFSNPIIKWETRIWGEIPADFGRK